MIWDAAKLTNIPLPRSPTSTPQRFRQCFFGAICARQEQCLGQKGSDCVSKIPTCKKLKISEPRKISHEISYPRRCVQSLLPEDKSHILQNEIRAG